MFNPTQKKYSKTCVKRPLSKIPKLSFQDQLLLIAGQQYRQLTSFKFYTDLLKKPDTFNLLQTRK